MGSVRGLGHAHVRVRVAVLVPVLLVATVVGLASPAAAVAPNAPRTVTAVAGDSQAVVKWLAPVANGAVVTGYVVTAHLDGTAQASQSFPAFPLTGALTGLVNGQTYTFTVTASSTDGPGPASIPSAPLLVGTPATPTGQGATAGNASATVKWLAPSSNGSPLTGFVVTPYLGTVAQSSVVFGATATSGVVTGLVNGQTYTFKVAATNTVGTGSAATTSATLVGTPAAPTTVAAVGGLGQATVSWTPGSDNGTAISAYSVTPVVAGVAQTPRVFASTATTQVITGLPVGVVHTFKVAAVNGVGTGPTLISNSALTGPSGPPAVPKIVGGNGRVTLTWVAPLSQGSPMVGAIVTPYLAGVAQPAVPTSAALTQVITGLVNGGSYTFTAIAINQAGPSAPSGHSAPVVVGAPSPPTGVSAVAGHAQATVKWTAALANGVPITGYEITPFIGAIAQPTRSFASTATTQVVTGLTNGQTYSFKVAALFSGGAGLPSSASSAVLIGSAAPPTGVSATGGAASATVSWTPPAGGLPVIGYVVTPYLGSVAQPTQSFGPGTSAVVTGLTNGSTYTFRVAAQNTVGTSPTVTTNAVLVGPSPAPTAVSATSGNGRATVKWTAPLSAGSPITAYLVVPVRDGVPQPAVTVGTVSPQVVTGLVNGSTYTFTVAAVNGGGASAASVPSAPVLVGAPAAPSGVSGAAGNGQITLKWNAPVTNGLAITGYLVTPHVAGVAQPSTTFASTAITQVLGSLTNGDTFTYTVAALVAGGSGPASTQSAAVTVGAPLAPTGISAVTGDGEVVVKWGAPGDNGSPITEYRITPYLGGAVAQAVRTVSGATTAVVTGLTNGSTYTFRVAAVNARGAGSAPSSSVVVVGTPGVPGSLWVAGGPAAGQLTVNWTAPAANGSPLTGYVLTPMIGTLTQPAIAVAPGVTSYVVQGFTVSQAYGFKLAATNARGPGLTSAVTAPVTVPVAAPVPAPPISAGWAHSCVIVVGGAIRCWGNNGDGQLGDGTRVTPAAPVDVVGITGAIAVTAGDNHTCALLGGGTVKCWGGNGYRQLGNGTAPSSSTPVEVLGLFGATAISAGTSHTCALVADGVKCWGWNYYGQLGNGKKTDSATPVAVTGLTGVVTAAVGVASGWSHSCVLLNSGGVKCWGFNGDGQLGDNTTTLATKAVDVVGLTGVSSISAGGYHSCAVVAGTARCWGSNSYGELGNATTTGSKVPVVVAGLSGITAMDVGNFHTCAIGSTGLHCWGDNGYGQLGTGTNTAANVPAAVLGISDTSAVAAGGGHTCAMGAASTRCWGFNGYRQLGQHSAQVDVVSYNVADGCSDPACNGGSGQDDLVSDLAAGGPEADVYALQDACSTRTGVATALGAGHRRLDGWDRTPATGGACGDATASAGNSVLLPTGAGTASASDEVVAYSQTDPSFGRNFTCTHTQIRFAPVLVCNTHLAADPIVARAQAAELLTWVTNNRTAWETVIVAGSFAMAPGPAGTGWDQAWTSAGFSNVNSAHLATDGAGLETDYIWVNAAASGTTVSLGQHSDHRALRTTVTAPVLASAHPIPIDV